MQDINSVVIVGNLTKDCGTDPYGRDFAYTQGGVAIATISIASNRSRKQNDGSYVDEVSYFDVKLFGNMAENLKPYLTKGQKVCVDGVLKQERWKDKNGATVSKVVILANQVQLVGGRREQGGETPQHGQQYQQPYQRQNQAVRQEQQAYATPEPPQGAGMFPEDIPF